MQQVSWASMVCMAGAGLLAVGTPVVLILVLARKKLFGWKPLLLGMAGFFVFALVLEQLLHTLVLRNSFLLNNVWAYSTYGALAAGVFEEVGRYCVILLFLKKQLTYKSALSYGVGHAGMEALAVGAIAAVNNIALSVLVNSGMAQQILAAQLPQQTVDTLIAQLTQTAPALFLLGGVERMLTFPIHMALTMLVFAAVRNKDVRYLLGAILLHALLDFPAAMFQKGMLSLPIVYGWVLLFVAAGVYVVFAARRWFFAEEGQRPAAQP
ncbi:MAG: YhfC family glutamic-type intramembrane protease [Eubacteriales bacterium]|nr:YhfC family glutamic-type intramembrane protease [Eubacteriales bacterium]